MQIFTTMHPQYKSKKIQTDYNSPYYGVSFSKCSKTWRLYIASDYLKLYLGHYRDDRIAAVIYNIFEAQLNTERAKFDPRIGAPNYRNNSLYVGDIGPIPDAVINFVEAKLKGDKFASWTRSLELQFHTEVYFPDHVKQTDMQNLLHSDASKELQYLYEQQLKDFPDLLSQSQTSSSGVSPTTQDEFEEQERRQQEELEVLDEVDLIAYEEESSTDRQHPSFEKVTEYLSNSFESPNIHMIETFEYSGTINAEDGFLYDSFSDSLVLTPTQVSIKITTLTAEHSIASLYINGKHFILGINEDTSGSNNFFSVFHARAEETLIAIFNTNTSALNLARLLAPEDFSYMLQSMENPDTTLEQKTQIANNLITEYYRQINSSQSKYTMAIS